MTIEMRKPNQRGVSTFTAAEHFIDFSRNECGPSLKSEIAGLIESDVQTRLDYEKFENGVKYCNQLSGFQVKESYLASLKQNPNPMDSLSRMLRLEQWPPGLRWGLEAAVMITIVVTVVLLFPWQKVIPPEGKSYVTLYETEKPEKPTEVEAPTFDPSSQIAQYEDEGLAKQAPPTAAEATPPSKPPAPTPSPPPTPVAVAAAASLPPKSAPSPAVPLTATPVAATEKPKATTGFLFRGTIQVTNLDPTANKFTASLTDLGARKAGEVELGWVKGSTRYYHFTIPEAKYEDFIKVISEHGKPVIAKENHPRRMPEGIVRVILVVSEKGSGP